jgi:hypothetical protein
MGLRGVVGSFIAEDSSVSAPQSIVRWSSAPFSTNYSFVPSQITRCGFLDFFFGELFVFSLVFLWKTHLLEPVLHSPTFLNAVPESGGL